nr:MAG TPA: hypothetical protein [Caudoviricetes sp.]
MVVNFDTMPWEPILNAGHPVRLHTPNMVGA